MTSDERHDHPKMVGDDSKRHQYQIDGIHKTLTSQHKQTGPRDCRATDANIWLPSRALGTP